MFSSLKISDDDNQDIPRILEWTGSGPRGPHWRQHPRPRSQDEMVQKIKSIVDAKGRDEWAVSMAPSETDLGIVPVPKRIHETQARKLLESIKNLPAEKGRKVVYYHRNFGSSTGSFDMIGKRITTMPEDTAQSGFTSCASQGGLVIVRTGTKQGPFLLIPLPESDKAGKICAKPKCDKPATLQCSFCQATGVNVDDSSFCSEECYKSVWKEHREKIHGFEMCGHCAEKHWKDVVEQIRVYRFSVPNGEIIHETGDIALAIHRDLMKRLGVPMKRRAHLQIE